MRMPHVDDRVRLLDGLPESGLSRGSVGVVCSQWDRGDSAHEPTFEVEFVSPVDSDRHRHLVRAGQLTLDGDDDTSR